ncbi:MAG: hypothetical protein WDO16_19160 [Bacteroidota bacterium]
MKKIFVPLFIAGLILACNNNENAPDVSGIKVDLGVQRFDQDFFAMDTTGIEKGVSNLQVKYPTLLPLFLQTIVGVQDDAGVKDFYSRYKQVFDSSQKIYAGVEPVKKQIEQAFKYVKYYFPSYQLPRTITTVVGPMNSREIWPGWATGIIRLTLWGRILSASVSSFISGKIFLFIIMNTLSPM